MGLSIEVIDSMNGRSAAGVRIVLWHAHNAQWHKVATGCIKETGEVLAMSQDAGAPHSPDGGGRLERGTYRLRLELDPYFAGYGITPIHSSVEVVFRVFDPCQSVRLLFMITSSSCITHVVPLGSPASIRPTELVPSTQESDADGT